MGWPRRTYLNYAGSGFWTGAAALRNRSPTVTIPVDYRPRRDTAPPLRIMIPNNESHLHVGKDDATPQAAIGLSHTSGGGMVTAVDEMRFVVPVRTVGARPNRKYFARNAVSPG
jgi:hypothetical protein